MSPSVGWTRYSKYIDGADQEDAVAALEECGLGGGEVLDSVLVVDGHLWSMASSAPTARAAA